MNTMSGRGAAVALSTLLCALGAGCATRPYNPGAITQDNQKVVLVPGVLGYYWSVDSMADRLDQAPNSDVQIWDWTALWPSSQFWILERALENLSDQEKNHRRAERLATELVAWRRSNPDTPLYLVGVSGGAGIVLWTCEHLPPDFQIQKVIVLSAAVSPGFDLQPACSRSIDGIYSFHSEKDTILRDKTRDRGTIDRKWVSGAGWRGFDCPDDSHCAQGLRELSWTPDMCAFGHWGNHFGCMAPAFVREYVVPLIAPGATDSRWRHCREESN